jgi:hypothetical protein
MNGTFVCPVCKKPGTFVDPPDDPPYVLVCQHCGEQITEIVVASSYDSCQVVSDGLSVPFPPRSAAPTPRLDMGKVLAELKAEREQIEEAVLSLERLARGQGKGPGRPPQWMADMITPKRRAAKSPRSRPLGSNDPARGRSSDDPGPPLETASVAVPVPRPKPNLPPAAAALPLPLPELADAVAGKKRPVS